jgi:hypothetical protein
MDIVQTIENVKKWQLRKGKSEYLRHLEGGKPLTARQAILAKCYECNCGYDDGAEDCKIFACPLYCFMPFRAGGPQKSRVMSEEQKARMRGAAKIKNMEL